HATARQRLLQEMAEGRMTVQPRPGSLASQEVSPEDLNLVLLNELRELKQNQRRLHDELQRLQAGEARAAEHHTNSHAPQLHHPLHHVPTGALQKAATSVAQPAVQDKAVVIYDLTKFPATVKTANETFCRMLGYELHEVLGQPWTKFVHPV